MSGWMAQADPQAAYAAQRPGSRRPLLRFAVIFVVVLVVVLVAVAALAPAAPAPSCPTAPSPCSVPPKPPSGQGGSTGGQTGNAAAELVVGTAWSSSKLGFSFHYDADAWNVQDDEPDLLQLKSPSDPAADREDWVIVEGAAASSDTPDQMIAARVASLSQSVPDLAEDTDGTYYEVKGAEIGDVPGIARVYVGTLDDTDGTPIAPVRYTIVAASYGQLTIAVTVRTLDPDAIADHGPPALTWHMLSRQLVDAILEDIRWPAAQ